MKSEEAFSLADKNENLGLGAVIAALPFLFFLPYLIKDKKYSSYCMFRANQSLVTFIVLAVLGVALTLISLISFVPIIGGIITGIAGFIIKLVSLFYYLDNLILAILGSGKKVFIFGMIDILK